MPGLAACTGLREGVLSDKLMRHVVNGGRTTPLRDGQSELQQFRPIQLGVERYRANARTLGIGDDLADLRATAVADNRTVARTALLSGFGSADGTFVVNAGNQHLPGPARTSE